MPTVEKVSPLLSELGQKIAASSKDVRDVLVWGSYVKNKSNRNFVLRDVDVIAKVAFFSEDLIAISDDSNIFKLSTDELADLGYDPEVVSFTKAFAGIKDFNLDHWAISSDKKLLHWGPTLENKHEWDELRQEAEDYAVVETGVSRRKLTQASQKAKNSWASLFDHYVYKQIAGMPKGWYQSEHSINEILAETESILRATK